jgi:hypothetical protein
VWSPDAMPSIVNDTVAVVVRPTGAPPSTL